MQAIPRDNVCTEHNSRLPRKFCLPTPTHTYTRHTTPAFSSRRPPLNRPPSLYHSSYSRSSRCAYGNRHRCRDTCCRRCQGWGTVIAGARGTTPATAAQAAPMMDRRYHQERAEAEAAAVVQAAAVAAAAAGSRRKSLCSCRGSQSGTRCTCSRREGASEPASSP